MRVAQLRTVVLVLSLSLAALVVGPAGATEPTCFGRTATPGHLGTEGRDVIEGTSGPDVIIALGARDEIYGRGGGDRICGGDGNDEIRGNQGRDRVDGGRGDDSLRGHEGDDRVFGRGGHDGMQGNNGSDRMFGGRGDDGVMTQGRPGSEGTVNVAHGGFGDDRLTAAGGTNQLFGDAGNDSVSVWNFRPDDLADGGAGTDECRWDDGDEVVDCEPRPPYDPR